MKEDKRAVSDLSKFFTVNFKCSCVNKNIDLFSEMQMKHLEMLKII